MEQIRSFIAIELPEEVKEGLKQVEDRLKSSDSSSAKWVDPQNIHLTLKFLGNVDVDKIDSITRAIQDAARTTTSFELKIDGTGCFPNSRRVQTIWIGLTGDIDKLEALQRNIELWVAPLGFPTEKRPFKPHLTLARVRDYIDLEKRQVLGETVCGTQIELDLRIRVNSISLMRSQLTPAGAIYSKLCSVELKSPC
jgi:RNA 2',3'-cyclic 3'-phosphodiesterase